MSFCKCGCGTVVKNNYVRGHNSKNRKTTLETRKKMSNTHKSKYKDSLTQQHNGIRICECGCGETFKAKVYWKNGKHHVKKYISGHNSREDDKKQDARRTIRIAAAKSHKIMRGKNHPWHKGQSYISKVRGRYVLKCRDNSVEAWARIIMANKIGRQIKHGEVVHHIDGNKTNDHPDNLMLFSSISEHIKWHWDNGMGPR